LRSGERAACRCQLVVLRRELPTKLLGPPLEPGLPGGELARAGDEHTEAEHGGRWQQGTTRADRATLVKTSRKSSSCTASCTPSEVADPGSWAARRAP